MKQKEAIAFHEAGHAVAMMRFDQRIKAVSVEGNEDYSGICKRAGRLYLSLDREGDISPTMERRMQDCVVSLLAGIEAQRKFSPRSVRKGHAEGDHRSATHLALHVNGTPEQASAWIAWLEVRTRDLVSCPQNWCAIEALAERLLEEKTIVGKEAESIIRKTWRECCRRGD